MIITTAMKRIERSCNEKFIDNTENESAVRLDTQLYLNKFMNTMHN